MNEGYESAIKTGYEGPNGNPPMSPKNAESQEIDHFMSSLYSEIERLDSTTQHLIERTARVASMDRSIPDAGDKEPQRSAETEFGSSLQGAELQLASIRDRLQNHIYRLEI